MAKSTCVQVPVHRYLYTGCLYTSTLYTGTCIQIPSIQVPVYRYVPVYKYGVYRYRGIRGCTVYRYLYTGVTCIQVPVYRYRYRYQYRYLYTRSRSFIRFLSDFIKRSARAANSPPRCVRVACMKLYGLVLACLLLCLFMTNSH